ncbi:MAG: hypothetical protein V4592_23080 [Bacteroidota bacterium]
MQPNTVKDRESFVKFIEGLLQDFAGNKDKWENESLSDFLEAVGRYTQDIQGYYNNSEQQVDADIATWQVFADILKGASMYE